MSAPESPYADAVARELARAPRQLTPSDAAAIGNLIGPLSSEEQGADAA